MLRFDSAVFSTVGMRDLGRLVVLGLLLSGTADTPQAWASRATVAVGGQSAMATPPPVPSPNPSPDPSPLATVTPAEGKRLMSEFVKAQRTQLKAADHRQDLELKELSASHKARIKEWDSREKGLRRAFFKEHSTGPERRTYVQDFIKRRKAFRVGIAEERSTKVKDHELRRQQLREDHVAKLKEFEAILKRGERPPERLWPQPGV